jgi:hypothetical protein
MVSFDQHIVLSADAQFFISVLILVLILLVLAVVFVGRMIYQLSVAVRTQSEMLRVEGRKAGGKRE